MTIADLVTWVDQNPTLAYSVIVLISILLLLIARKFITRGLIALASHTTTKADDILLKYLRPTHTSLLVPLAIIYLFAYLIPDYEVVIKKGALFLIMWVTMFTLSAILSALNEIYEGSPSYNGVSIQSYYGPTLSSG